MHLEVASLHPPKGLAALIEDLGSGENGFGGTAVPRGVLTLDEYLLFCSDTNDHRNLKSGHIPRTFFWFLDDKREAIGIVRMWHYLNESLRERTGHISYYICRDKRGKGYGSEALRLALLALKEIGERKALIIADLDNIASTKVILVNGGKLENIGKSGEGKNFGRYWIQLDA